MRGIRYIELAADMSLTKSSYDVATSVGIAHFHLGNVEREHGLEGIILKLYAFSNLLLTTQVYLSGVEFYLELRILFLELFI